MITSYTEGGPAAALFFIPSLFYLNNYEFSCSQVKSLKLLFRAESCYARAAGSRVRLAYRAAETTGIFQVPGWFDRK
jgi:hypothetical protein